MRWCFQARIPIAWDVSSLAQQTPSIQTVFQEASDAVGYDVWALVQEGPLERLNQTELTQVAMLASDVAVYRVLQAHALPAVSFMAGHSLGEYAALVCAEALDFTEAIRLVQTRGRLMQQFVPLGQGAMAAIVGLTDEQVEQLCAQVSQAGERVTPANYNAIGQVVVAGHHAAVLRLIAAEAAQARCTLIPVSVPCHCELLRDMSAAFGAIKRCICSVPRIPVIHNVDASAYTTAEEIRPYLAKQLYSPVQWVKSIQTLISRSRTLLNVALARYCLGSLSD